MATVSSGISLSENYYLRHFYALNKDVIKNSGRNGISKSELSYEDSRALRNALKALDKYEYSDNDNEDNVKNTIKAFITTYNNTLESANDSNTDSMKRYARKLKNLTSKYSDQLEDIGISIKTNGQLSYNENLLKSAKIDKVKEVFGKDAAYTKQMGSVSKYMNSASLNDVYSQLTGKGQRINITL